MALAMVHRPVVDYEVLLHSPQSSTLNARRAVLSAMYVACVKETVAADGVRDQGTLAGYGFALDAVHQGLVLSVSGYSDKINVYAAP